MGHCYEWLAHNARILVVTLSSTPPHTYTHMRMYMHTIPTHRTQCASYCAPPEESTVPIASSLWIQVMVDGGGSVLVALIYHYLRILGILESMGSGSGISATHCLHVQNMYTSTCLQVQADEGMATQNLLPADGTTPGTGSLHITDNQYQGRTNAKSRCV